LGSTAQAGNKTCVEKGHWSPHHESSRPKAHIGSGQEKMCSAEGEGDDIVG
jgi:hypothetical protein